MPTPRDIAIDLHDLWFAQNALTEMQGAHDSAYFPVSSCSPSYALSRPDSIGLGSNGFYDDWQVLKDQVTDMLTTNSRNLADTATAIGICIQTFTGTDSDVEREFNERKKDIPYE